MWLDAGIHANGTREPMNLSLPVSTSLFLSAPSRLLPPPPPPEKPAMKKKHDRAGLVGCANSGKNTNSSGFYVTLAPSPQCDGKHVVFGEVTEGLDVLERIDAEAASESGEPRVPVFIGDCGVISAK